jgi:DNA-binding NtrC family response regulator
MVDQQKKEGIVVLVVEDETLLRSELIDAFPYFNFEVIAAEDADEGLAILHAQSSRIQALFTDVHLPSAMNGLALARYVHDHWPDIAVLITSGYGTPDAGEMPDDSHFVLKPYRIGKIAAQIKELVQERAC